LHERVLGTSGCTGLGACHGCPTGGYWYLPLLQVEVYPPPPFQIGLAIRRTADCGPSTNPGRGLAPSRRHLALAIDDDDACRSHWKRQHRRRGHCHCIGGPGAVFWMWGSGLFAMATKYSEAVLGLKFREQLSDGSVAGGPMYYLRNGVRSPVLAWIFAFLAG